MLSCGDVASNPGPQRRILSYDTDSDDGSEGNERVPNHPIAEQLERMQARGIRLTVDRIAPIIVRYADQGKPKGPHIKNTYLDDMMKRNHEQLVNARANNQATEGLIAERTQLREAISERKKMREYEANERAFDNDKWATYNRVMNPRSTQKCLVKKEEVEKALTAKCSAAVPDDTPVPAYMPKVHTTMADFRVTVRDLRDSLKGKKGKAAAGGDLLTYAMLRGAISNDRVAELLTAAINNVLDGTDDIPLEWTDARITLLFKGKGEPTVFDNYRPLAITSILGKALNTVIKKKMMEHCLRFQVIDQGVQKGFMEKVSGCLDHIAAMMQLMRVAKRDKGTFYALLLDLKAAYDSVPHDKLWMVLKHVGISEQVLNYLMRMYKQSMVYVKTQHYTTGTIPYEKGVLQGDTLSPLLFTIFFMVVIRAAERDHEGKGFLVTNSEKKNFLHHLKAFADDMNAVDRTLDNLKRTWLNLKEGLDWCGLEVNKSKCRIMCFENGKYVQQDEGIQLTSDFTVTCGVKESAKFLGLNLSACMQPLEVENLLKNELLKVLKHISSLNFSLRSKLFFYEVGVLAKFRWWFSIYENISFSTVRHLQCTAYSYFRMWGNLSNKFTGETISSKKGYGIEDLRTTYRAARSIGLLNGLKASDEVTREAYRSKATIPPAASKDRELMNLVAGITQPPSGSTHDYTTKRGLLAEARAHTDAIEPRSKLKGLRWIWEMEAFSDKEATLMKDVLRGLSDRELRWGLRAMCDKLPTAANLHHALGLNIDETYCPLCRHEGRCHRQTLMHVLNHCPVALNGGRYTVRHDAVLTAITERLILANQNDTGFYIWADLPDHRDKQKPHGYVNETAMQPDILMVVCKDGNEHLVIIELTCPFESRDGPGRANWRKMFKYSTIREMNIRSQNFASVSLHCIEVGSRGFIATTLNEISPYLQCGRGHPTVRSFLSRLGGICLKQSMRIYERRNTRE